MTAFSPATARLLLAAHIGRSTVASRHNRIHPLWSVLAGAVLVWVLTLCLMIGA